MEATIIESGLTGRVTRIELIADSFPEERILRILFDGLTSGSLFELTKDGEPAGSFTFTNCRKVEDQEEDSQ